VCIYLLACIPRCHNRVLMNLVFSRTANALYLHPCCVEPCCALTCHTTRVGVTIKRHTTHTHTHIHYTHTQSTVLLFAAPIERRRQTGDVPRRANMAHSLLIHRFDRARETARRARLSIKLSSREHSCLLRALRIVS